jgi:crotonobetainyl-CoA:carnitine CoA-transferase CaiB-like acyl-CoA transferase
MTNHKENYMLDDIVVLEAGSRVAVGYAGKLLRDGGATVVRLEPAGGDPIRSVDPAYAEHLHAGKGSVTDVTASPTARALADRIDVVLGDEAPATQALIDELRVDHPRLMIVNVSPYGLDGPDATTPATDFTLQGEAGISLVHPSGDRPAITAGVPLAELTGGAAAAMAVVAGLLADDADPSPVTADISLFESAIALQQFPWLSNRIEHHSPYPLPQAPVPGVERASDGWVCIVSVTPPQWKDFKRIAQVPALDDPRFDTLNDRVVLTHEVTALVREFTSRHTIDELVELGAANRVPIAPVTTPGTIAAMAPFAARDSFVPSATGEFIAPRPPFCVDADDSYTSARLAAPGQDDGRTWSLPRRVRNSADGINPQRPLEGLRVVELGTFQAGPMVTMNLASLGAEVIKVETVNRPDLIRYNGVPTDVDRSWERGAPFLGANLGKKDITADLADPRGLAVVRDLIAEADVVLENYGPRVLESRGLDYQGVREINPDIVMVRMPAWGLVGPWRDRPGFTYTVNAASGMAELTGYADGEPMLTGTVVDPFAAFVASFVTIAAIRRRRISGRGTHLEIPLCDVAIQLTAQAVAQHSATGEARSRTGNARTGAAPQGVYRTVDDEQVAMSVVTDAQWTALAALPWAKAWAGDERYATMGGRHEHAAELDSRLRRAYADLGAAQVVEELRAAGVPTARLEVGDDVITHPQLIFRDRIVEITHPVIGTHRYLAGPVRFVEGPDMVPRGPAPLFGQHNLEVLSDLGRTPKEIAAMTKDGLLSDSPFNAPFDRTVPLQ